MMIAGHIPRVIVVDSQGRPIGTVSSTDILVALAYATPERTLLPVASGQNPVVASVPSDLTPKSRPVSEEAVRLRAYQKWEASGRPSGDGVNVWLEAERELT
jgi:hypothetical protein